MKYFLFLTGEVFDGSRTNEDVFNAIALPIVDKVMEGFDGLAYFLRIFFKFTYL